MSDTPFCTICTKTLTPETSRTFKRQAIQKLIIISEKLKDVKANIFNSMESVDLHNSCYVVYTRDKSDASTSRKRKRINVSNVETTNVENFDFSQHCFLCGDLASDTCIQNHKKNPKIYPKIYIANNDTIVNIKNIIDKLKNENDNYDLVKKRLKLDKDLATERARYHSNCYKSLYYTYTTGLFSHKLGRPCIENISNAVDFVIDYLRRNSDECQFSLKNILNQYQSTEIINVRYIQEKLSETLGNDVIIYSINQDYIICFVDARDKILCNDWYQNEKENKEEERKRIVTAAANIILQDIRSKVYDFDEYPAPNFFLNDVSSMIPFTLKQLLEIIIKKIKK